MQGFQSTTYGRSSFHSPRSLGGASGRFLVGIDLEFPSWITSAYRQHIVSKCLDFRDLNPHANTTSPHVDAFSTSVTLLEVMEPKILYFPILAPPLPVPVCHSVFFLLVLFLPIHFSIYSPPNSPSSTSSYFFLSVLLFLLAPPPLLPSLTPLCSLSFDSFSFFFLYPSGERIETFLPFPPFFHPLLFLLLSLYLHSSHYSYFFLSILPPPPPRTPSYFVEKSSPYSPCHLISPETLLKRTRSPQPHRGFLSDFHFACKQRSRPFLFYYSLNRGLIGILHYPNTPPSIRHPSKSDTGITSTTKAA